MADEPSYSGNFFDSSSGGGQKKKPDLGWGAYSWTPYQWAAYNQQLKMEPVYDVAGSKEQERRAVQDYWSKLYEEEEPARRVQQPGLMPTEQPVVQQQQPTQPEMQKPTSLGEAMVRYWGKTRIDPVANLFGVGPDSRRSEISPGFQDFTRAAYYGAVQPAAAAAGSVIDLVARPFTGQRPTDTRYTFSGNLNQRYNAQDPYTLQGIPRFLGQFAPDVAMSLGSTALFKMGMRAAIPGLAEAMLAGGARPMTMFGRVISPAATSLDRAAFSVGAAAPTFLHELPEVLSGRETQLEFLGSLATSTIGGRQSAGTWTGGSRLLNAISDAGSNMVANAAQTGVFAALPGGREVSMEEVLAGQAFGAALGTAFGVMQKPTPAVRVSQASQTAPMPESVSGSIFRDAEMAVYGKSDIPEAATTAQAMQSVAARDLSEVRSISRNPDGTVSSINETKVQTNAFPEAMSTAAAQQAAHLERKAYANALVASTNPDALIKLLDLNRPEGSTPDIVAQAIIDEVLVQPGKGINEVERRLAAANMDSPIFQGQAGPIPAAEPAAPAAAPLVDVQPAETTPAAVPVEAPMQAEAIPAAEVAAPEAQQSIFARGNVPVADPRYNILPAPEEIVNRPTAVTPLQPPPIRAAEAQPEVAAVTEAVPVVESVVPKTVDEQIAENQLLDSGLPAVEEVGNILGADVKIPTASVKKSKIGKKMTGDFSKPAKKAAEAVVAASEIANAIDAKGSAQNKKTARKQREQLADFFREGEVDLGKQLTGKYRGGGRKGVAKEAITEMIGLPTNTIKRMVDEGVEYFADGAIKVIKQGDRYKAAWVGAKTMDADTKQAELREALDLSNPEALPPKVRELAEQADRVDGAVFAAKQVAEDLQQVFEFSEPVPYMKKSTGGRTVQESRLSGTGMSHASVGEALEAFRTGNDKEQLGVGDLTIDKSGLATGYERWLRGAGTKLRQATEEAQSAMTQMDRVAGENVAQRLGTNSIGEEVTPLILSRYIMSRYAPEGLRQVSQKWLNINTSPEMRDHFQSTQFQRFENTNPLFLNAIMDLVDSYSKLSEDAALSGFRKIAGRVDNANKAADYLASKIGVDDPEKIKNIYDKESTLSVEEQTLITERIAELLETDKEAANSAQALTTYAQYNAGRNDWIGIDKTLEQNSKQYNWTLRDLPLNSIMSSAAAIYIMNEYVDKLEDDETVLGVPGKTLKRFLGSGNAGYVVAGLVGLPGMHGKHKSAAKVGTKFGNLMMSLDTKRQLMIDKVRDYAGLGRYSLPDILTPEQFRAEVESIVAKNYSDADGNKYVPGTEEFESKVREVMAIHRDSRTETVRPLGKQVGNAGTISDVQLGGLDYSQMIERNTFFREHINDKRNEAELVARNTETGLISAFNEVWKDVRLSSLEKDDARIVDAMVENDMLQTDITIASENMSPEAVLSAREMVNNRIRDKYFKNQNVKELRVGIFKKDVTRTVTEGSTIDEKAYGDYLRTQEVANKIRGAHYASLVGRGEGTPWYNAKGHALKLDNDLSDLRATFGSIEEGLKEKEKRYKNIRSKYEAVFAEGGRDAVKAEMPNYGMESQTIRNEIRQDKAKLTSLKSDITSIEKSVKRLRDIDKGIQRSQEAGYIIRHRNGDAAFVLRLEYDNESGLVGERREYTNARAAREAEEAYARRALAARRSAEPALLQKTIDKYEEAVEKSLASDEQVDPKLEEQAAAAYQKRAALAGYKPMEEMSSAEVRRELEAYGISLQVYGNKERKVRASATAARAVMTALLSANQLRAQISVSRTADGFLPSMKDSTKGNETLTTVNTGDVMMYSGDEAPTVESLIDAMEEMVDGSIDRQQLKQFLENNLTYRDNSKDATGKMRETIWIDMVGLRAIASRYLEPSIPNLARRNNIQGYYNPDGNWTPKQKWDWMTKGFEMMQGQVAANTQKTIMRPVIADAITTLRKAEVRNGLVEYLTEYGDPTDKYLGDPTSALSRLSDAVTRFTAVGTLALSVGSYFANRAYGISNAKANFGMNVRTRYGLQRQEADGTLGQVQWFSDKGQADYEYLKRKDEGQTGWLKVEGYTPRQADFRAYAMGVFSIMAPKLTFQAMAKISPYYNDVLAAVEKANIQEGTILGNTALRGGIPTGSKREKAVLASTKIMRLADQQNNWMSALLAAESARVRLGLSDTDWLTMTSGGRTDATERISYAYKQRLKQDSKISSDLIKEIDDLQQRLDNTKDLTLQASLRNELLIKQDALQEEVMTSKRAIELEKEINALQKQIDNEQDAGTKAKLEEKVSDKRLALQEASTMSEKAVMQTIMKSIVSDRRFEQGGWSKEDMTKIERYIKKYSASRPFMVFVAPALRQSGASSALYYRALRTAGVSTDKLKRYRSVITGAALMTFLMGSYAVPAMLIPGFAVADITNTIEFLAELFLNDDEDKLNQMTGRKFWEDTGGAIVASAGGDRKVGSETVRALWTDGLIKYTTDINIGSSGGIIDAVRMPISGLMISTTNNAMRVASDLPKLGFSWQGAYTVTNALPASAKKLVQGGIQLARGQKLDRYGNPIEDPLNPTAPGKVKPFGLYDAVRHVLFGKSWPEVRSALEAYEGGTPVLTEEDRVAFARKFSSLPYLTFSGLGKEQATAALFERDAADLQRMTSAIYKEKYRAMADSAKESFSRWVENGPAMASPEGLVTPKEMMVMVGASGNKAEFELRGSGFEKARSLAYGYADRYAYSRAAADATRALYGDRVNVNSSDSDFDKAPGPFPFMMAKFGQAVRNAYVSGSQRRQGRRAME
jgi:hypothetical protein